MEELDIQQLGLTKLESKVYISLLKLGSTTTGPLIKITQLHRATIYDILKRLIEKGLVIYITKEKTKHFQAVNPEHFLDLIEEQKQLISKKENEVKKIVKLLKKTQEQSKNKESSHIFQGKNGLKTLFEDLLNYKEYCAFASKGKFKEILDIYYDQFQKKKKQKKIRSRILIDETLRGSDYVKSIVGNIRFLSKEYNYPSATFIYNHKVAFVVFSEDPIAFLIESKEVAESYKSYFELLWKIAKP